MDKMVHSQLLALCSIPGTWLRNILITIQIAIRTATTYYSTMIVGPSYSKIINCMIPSWKDGTSHSKIWHQTLERGKYFCITVTQQYCTHRWYITNLSYVGQCYPANYRNCRRLSFFKLCKDLIANYNTILINL